MIWAAGLLTLAAAAYTGLVVAGSGWTFRIDPEQGGWGLLAMVWVIALMAWLAWWGLRAVPAF